jgi:hypothetical protein
LKQNKEQLSELSKDSVLMMRGMTLDNIPKFWQKITADYIQLSEMVLKELHSFASTYLWGKFIGSDFSEN